MDGIKQTVAQAGAAFREDGAVGSAFKTDGTAGGTAQAVGGPLDKHGAVGHQFTTEGAIGGSVQAAAEKVSGSAAAASSNPDVAHRDGNVDRK